MIISVGLISYASAASCPKETELSDILKKGLPPKAFASVSGLILKEYPSVPAGTVLCTYSKDNQVIINMTIPGE